MKTYAQQQAAQLLDFGTCHFPLKWSDIAAHAARKPAFAMALKRAHKGDTMAIRAILEASAVELCKAFDHEA